MADASLIDHHPRLSPMTWVELPDTRARVLFDARKRPAAILARSGDTLADIKLELEGRHGWRVQLTALRNHDHPRGWLLAVTWVGLVGRSCTYNEVKKAPICDHYSGPHDKSYDLQDLIGYGACSMIRQLSDEWRGQPKGTWVVWVSHPGIVGFLWKAGIEPLVIWALDLIDQPVPSGEVSAVLNRLQGIMDGPEYNRRQQASDEANQGYYTGSEVLSELTELCTDLQTGIEGVEVPRQIGEPPEGVQPDLSLFKQDPLDLIVAIRDQCDLTEPQSEALWRVEQDLRGNVERVAWVRRRSLRGDRRPLLLPYRPLQAQDLGGSDGND